MLARAADAEPGLELRRGAAVTGLTARRRSGVPNVTGVRLESGETIAADLVVDAMGRRSELPRLLRACGVEHVPEQAEDPGFAYYSRYFRTSGGMPELRALQLTPIGSFSIITLPADDGTWSVTLLGSSSDRPLKRLRFEDTWNAVVRACPLHAHWLDGEPLTGVLAMGGMVDRYRRYAVDGRPVATGIAAIGDAWACTNPSLGRGIALGLAHAARLRELVRTAPADPQEFALAWDAVTERHLTPWYRATVATDRARFAEIEALRAGRPALAATDRAAALRTALPLAMGLDADVFRAGMEVVNCLTLPQHVFASPGFVDRVLEVARAHNGALPPGPDREQLLELLAEPEPDRRDGGDALRVA
jgi:2-polyprenyl-6-methoxyphenol hydroxylase-like FAD-dependent oxidoreductase